MSRIRGGLFGVALLAGVFLIVWNALVAPDAPPPARPATDLAEATARDLAPVPALPVAAAAPAPETQAGSAPPLATFGPAAEPPASHHVAEPRDAAAATALESVADTPELMSDMRAREAAEALQPEPVTQVAEPTPLEPVSQLVEIATLAGVAEAAPQADSRAPEQPIALPTVPEPAGEAQLNADEAVAPEPALAMAAQDVPEPIRDAETATPNETYEQALAVTTPAMPELTHEAQVIPGEIVASEPHVAISTAAEPARDAEPVAANPVGASDQTLAMSAPAVPEPARSSDAQPGTPSTRPEPTNLGESRSELKPESKVLASTGASAASEMGTASSTSPDAGRARAETTIAAAAPSRSLARERVAFAGTWAAVPEACSPAAQEEDVHLVARIGARGGRAGDTSCAFRTIRRRANTWLVNAACSDGEERWRSDVRLSLTRGRLTWSSRKGSTTYLRCPRA